MALEHSVDLHVRELGAGGLPVVLLHGLFGSGDNLGALASALAERHRVLSVDLRNHGRSAWSEDMRLESMAADVESLLRKRKLDRVALVGHSLGGKVAMQFALRWPQRVAALVVVDIAPVAYGRGHDAVFAGLEAVQLEQVRRRGDAEAMLAAHVQEPMVRGFLLKSLYRDDAGHYRWRFNWPVLRSGYDALSAAPSGSPFPGPTLFIKGELSDYLLERHEAAVRRLFPAFEVRVLTGCGHWLHAEKPTLFNRLVARFLERVAD